MFKYFLLVWLFSFSTNVVAKENLPVYCDSPRWAAPAESNQGTFKGDLLLDCWITEFKAGGNLQHLKAGMIQKLEAESTIDSGPLSFQWGDLPSLKWEVSHHLKENGNAITIREEAILATDSKDRLVYRTHSKEVTATGMASYLRSVNFSMDIKKLKSKTVHVEFRNEVAVDRPWYALDLLFAPIARNICFEKMEEVKGKILPWIAKLLSE